MSKLKKIIEYGFYLFILVLPWQTRWIFRAGSLNGGVWEYGSLSLYGFDLLLVVLLLLALIKIKSWYGGEETRDKKKIWLAIVGLLVIVFLSIYWSQDKILSFYAFLRLFEGLGLFWLIYKIGMSLKKFGLALVLSGVVQSLLAIWQFLGQTNWQNKWLGLASNLPANLGASVVEADGERFLRAYGSLPHPNILAGFLVICLLVVIGLYLKSQSRIEKLLVLASSVIVTAGLFFSFSKSAWLAFIISLILIWLLIILNRNFDRIWPLAKISFAILMMAVSLMIIFKEPFLTRLKAEERLEVKSTTTRLTLNEQSFRLIRDYWYSGVGIGGYTLAVHDQIDSSFEAWNYQPVHNIYLLIMGELGVFGLLVFLIMVLELVRLFRWPVADPQTIVGLAVLVTLLVIGLFDHYLWSLPVGLLLFWLAIGYFVKGQRERLRIEDDRNSWVT